MSSVTCRTYQECELRNLCFESVLHRFELIACIVVLYYILHHFYRFHIYYFRVSCCDNIDSNYILCFLMRMWERRKRLEGKGDVILIFNGDLFTLIIVVLG